MAVFRMADFEPHIGTIFEVTPPGMGPVELELVEVRDTGSASYDGFSLLLRGSADSVFRHNTCKVRHPAMGEMELFLGPVQTGKTDAVYFQAIFSAPKGA